MTVLEWIAGAVVLIALLAVIVLPRVYENLFTGADGLPDPVGHPTQSEVAWKTIGGSMIQRAEVQPPVVSVSEREPIFRTLRLETIPLSDGRWQFKIRFLFFNSLSDTIGLEDIHAHVYERNVPTPGYATITYRGEVLLQQDNTILKDSGAYSLESRDGCEITLVLEMTRLEGAPLYGGNKVTAGPVRTVFGLLLDYYVIGASDIVRKEMPSDCLYLFEYTDREVFGTLKSVDPTLIEHIRAQHANDPAMIQVALRLEELLASHRLLRFTPRA